jgi:hypothetical protein
MNNSHKTGPGHFYDKGAFVSQISSVNAKHSVMSDSRCTVHECELLYIIIDCFGFTVLFMKLDYYTAVKVQLSQHSCVDNSLEDVAAESEAGAGIRDVIRESFLDKDFENKYVPVGFQLIHSVSLQAQYEGTHSLL